MTEKIETTWEVWQYEVWGNLEDGYSVNDRYCVSRNYPLTLDVEINNSDRPNLMFLSAFPTHRQIRKAIGIKSRVGLDVLISDTTIYVSSDSGYPLGELHCISHASLCPIHKLTTT